MSAAKATATANLSSSERSAIDALIFAGLNLEKAGQQQKDFEAREAALLLSLAEKKEALENVKRGKSFNAYALGFKRKAVEEVDDLVRDTLKAACKTTFKTGTEVGTKVYGAVPNVHGAPECVQHLL